MLLVTICPNTKHSVVANRIDRCIFHAELICPSVGHLCVSCVSVFDWFPYFPSYVAGDASSPHGSNCTIQFSGNGGTSGDGSKSTSPCLPASSGNEGLTRQQLDLISQIMQQTKANAAGLSTVTTTVNGQKQIQRPRTWNMQVQKVNKCRPYRRPNHLQK